MRNFGRWLLLLVGAAGAYFVIKALIVKYATIVTVALALWDDPQIQKARRRAAKKLQKAKNSIDKAAAKNRR